MDKKATIYEVAKRVGVSTATVSRVLNDSPNVSEDTKQKVEEMIEELNFSPQVTAQKLAHGKPQMLAVVVPSFTTPYYNEVLKGIKDEMKNIDMDIILYNTGSRNREEGLLRFLERGVADAFLIISIDVNEKVHQRLETTQTPAVLVNTSRAGYSSYAMNNYRGGYLAGEHLAGQGFESIGIIDSSLDSHSSKERLRGLKEALREKDLTVSDDFFVEGDSTKHAGYTEESGFEAIYKLEQLERFPDAIFCTNDTQAIGAMYALSELEMQVPEDVAIMGYDNIKLSKYLHLTTVDQKMYSTGVRAIKRLWRLLERPGDSPSQEIIDPILVERGSTAK